MNFAQKRIRIVVILLHIFSVGLSLCLPANAQDDFRPLVQQAIKAGAHRVVIEPGTYRLAPDARFDRGVVFPIRDAHDLDIVADGVTLICTRRARAIDFDGSHDVTLSGLTIDYEPLTFTQGTITAIAADHQSFTVKIHDGYPSGKAYDRAELIDQHTRFPKKGVEWRFYNAKPVWSDATPDVVQVQFKDADKSVAIGDFLTLSAAHEEGMAPHGVDVGKASRITLQNITVHASPGWGIIGDGYSDNSYLGCKVILGPKPKGATQERLLTTTWDALGGGNRVENCTVEDAGDDAWSIVLNSPMIVLKSEGHSAILRLDLGNQFNRLVVGNHIKQSINGPQAVVSARRLVTLEQAALAPETLQKIEAAKKAPPRPAWDQDNPWTLNGDLVQVDFEGASPFEVGQLVYADELLNRGFIFRGNRIKTQGRVLIKGGNGLIENNLIEGSYGLCVDLLDWSPLSAQMGLRHLIIWGNTFRDVGGFGEKGLPWPRWSGGVYLVAARGDDFLPSGNYNDILLENNLFENITVRNLIITSANGVVLRSNRFVRPQMNEQSPSLVLAQSTNVKFEGNTISNFGTLQKAVSIAPTVSNVSGTETTLIR